MKGQDNIDSKILIVTSADGNRKSGGKEGSIALESVLPIMAYKLSVYFGMKTIKILLFWFDFGKSRKISIFK